MILTVDIGNSNIVLTLFEDKKVSHKLRLETESKTSAKDYEKSIQGFFHNKGIETQNIEGIIISSVVPLMTNVIKNSLKFINAKILLIGDENVKTNVAIKINDPKTLGSDILMNVVAGKERFGENFIIVDMGTATTFDVVGKNGDFLGAVIAPGVNLSRKALSSCCAKLPNFEIKPCDKVIGKNTLDAMNSGIYFGYIGLIKEIVGKIKQEYGQEMKVCLTGGIAPKFINFLPFVDELVADLTAEGLRLVWEMNI